MAWVGNLDRSGDFTVTQDWPILSVERYASSAIVGKHGVEPKPWSI